MVAAGAAGALALQHLGAAPLPGCGLDSPCQRALAGPFGTLPGVGWPLAHLGLAWFVGELLAWGLATSGWSNPLRWATRVSGAGSLLLLGLAFQQGTPCPFCITAQLAHLGFVWLAERAPRVARAPRAEAGFGLGLVGVTAALALLGRARDGSGAAEEALAESVAAIDAGGEARAFTGRYRLGPEKAAIRLVLFTDYQCEDCKRIEAEAWALANERPDLSLSIKHYPLCKDCNRLARQRNANPHANACWAARAAEAAGILGGDAAFWRMHRWLFERGGSFTDASLKAGLVELGLPQGPFLELLHGAETRARVEADVEEALDLGILATPMVFVNGVELRGWNAQDALRRVVASVAERAPAPAGPEADRPAGALEKGLGDWLREPHAHVPLLPDQDGPRGKVRVLYWGDYLDPDTRELDRRLRAFQAAHDGVQLVFRHYPVDPDCIPSAPNAHPGACRAALAAEAARALGGREAFERLHAWLMADPRPLDAAREQEAATVAGVDLQAFRARLASEITRARIRADADAARRLGVQSIPFVYVNDRRVPRWRIEGVDVLERILSYPLQTAEDAATEAGAAEAGD